MCGELGALNAHTSAHGRPAAAYGGNIVATATRNAAAAAPCCNAGLMQAFCCIL